MSTRKTSAHTYVSKCGRLILLSSHLVRRITSRRKSLGRLREADYKKYEWLLEKLNLLYKPQPHDAPPGQLRERELVARKASIERLTDMWCDELRRHRWGSVTPHSFSEWGFEVLKIVASSCTYLGLAQVIIVLKINI